MKQYSKNDLESAVFRFIPEFKRAYNEGSCPLPKLISYACIEIVQQRQAHTDHDVEIIRSAQHDLENGGMFKFS